LTIFLKISILWERDFQIFVRQKFPREGGEEGNETWIRKGDEKNLEKCALIERRKKNEEVFSLDRGSGAGFGPGFSFDGPVQVLGPPGGPNRICHEARFW
jgi:hypothetical protein